MTAHPMLQPTDWAQTPDALDGAMPQTRLQLYRLIWDCALACTLKAPILQHVRTTFSAVGGATVAFATVVPASAFLGYWRFRSDVPRGGFPHGVQTPPVEPLQIADAWVSSPNAVTLGALIASMEDEGIGTPASSAKMLKDMLEPQDNTIQSRKPLLVLEANGRNQRQHVHVTEHGRSQLAAWERAGLLGRNSAVNQTIEAVASGDLSLQSGLQAVFNITPGELLDQAMGAESYIDSICQHWAGLGRDQGLQELAVARVNAKVKNHTGLPKWLDPEESLAPNHPLRRLKQEMEDALTQSRPEWESLEEREKADARLDWLLAYCSCDSDANQMLHSHLFGPMASFSALRAWLVGGSFNLGDDDKNMLIQNGGRNRFLA